MNCMSPSVRRSEICAARRGSPSWTSAGHLRSGVTPGVVHELGIVQHSSICDSMKTGIRHRVHIICDCEHRVSVESWCRTASPGRKSLCRSGEAPRAARRREIKGSFARMARRHAATQKSVGQLEMRAGYREVAASARIGPPLRRIPSGGPSIGWAAFFIRLADLSPHPWIEW
jgi:hypothetical protein